LPNGCIFSKDPFDPNRKENEIFTLTFHINQDKNELRLLGIRSDKKGLGGKALLALYNLARSAEINFITYFVTPGNIDALRFYFQMDFGKPADSTCCDWVVWTGS